MKSIRTFMTEKINESLSKEKLRNDWNRIWNAMENGMFIDMAFNFLANEGNLLKKFIERESEINALFAESISAGEEKRLRKEWGKLLNDMMYDEFAEQLYNFMDEATLARFIRFADGFMGESLNENEDAKIKELEKKLEKVEDKAEKAEDAAEDAEDKAKKADKEASKAEESVKNEKDFRSYAENKFKEVFGDDLDKDKMNEVVDGILKKYKKDADKGEWGTLVGVLNKSFGN